MLKKRYPPPSKYNETILMKRFEARETIFPFKTSLRAKGLEIYSVCFESFMLMGSVIYTGLFLSENNLISEMMDSQK